MNRGWLGLFIVAAVLGVLACDGDDGTGPQIDTQTVTLAAMKNSGITGTATIRTEEGASSSTVTVSLEGLTPTTTYIGHIHNTSCAEGGGIALALPNITGAANGTGSATAEVANTLLTSDHYFQYHLNISGAPEITCGDIPATGEAATRSDWLVEINTSDVTGFAVISDLAGATAMVRVELLEGLADGTVYDGHIHSSNCAAGGPIVLTLPQITGTASGSGSSEAVEVQDALLTVNHYFQYHLDGPQIGCGDISGSGIARTRRVELQEVDLSGITGEAVVSDTTGANSTVRVLLEGTTQDVEYPGHVHQGSCEVQGNIVHTLTSVTGGASGSGLAISGGVADNQLVTGFYFQYHDPVAGLPPNSCGNIVGSGSAPQPPPPPPY